MNKLISFGEVLVDQIKVITGSPAISFAGGAPANVAACYAKLGGKSFFIGGMATDDKAKFLLEELNKVGVNTDFVKVFPNSKTATAIVTLDNNNERSFEILRDATADTLFKKEHLDEHIFKQSLFFHFCSNTLTEQMLYETTLSAVDLARHNDMLVCFDVNLRFDLWSSQTMIEKRVSSFITSCDIIKMSLEELDFLASQAGKSHDEYILRCIDSGVSLVLVTDGKNPIICKTATTLINITPPSIIVEDSTGAGDAFIGSFLWYLGKNISDKKDFLDFLASEKRLKEALKFSAICGAITCKTKGAFAALPNKKDVDEFAPYILE